MTAPANLNYPSTTVCIPAHNESATIRDVIAVVQNARLQHPGLIEEIIVVDDRSSDFTASIASAAGARVVYADFECRSFGGSSGKGDALWAALRRCSTELVLFLDGDLTALNAGSLSKLIEPLVVNPDLQLVKGRFTRLCSVDGPVAGRVTMLTARPLLSLLHPELASFEEPLSGLFAGRVETLGSLWLDCDYGVDVGILLDIATMYGTGSILEVDIGEIRHRQRDLTALSSTAEQVARAILARATHSAVANADLSSRRPPPRKTLMSTIFY